MDEIILAHDNIRQFKNQLVKANVIKLCKEITVIVILIVFMVRCDSVKNKKKEDLCGRYSDKTESSSSIKSYGTTLKCDGTFESGMSENVPGGYERGYGSVDRGYFTGTWEIVKEIPDDVKQAVIEYGLKDDDYAIIKYSSSNGVQGYCLYYKINGYYSLNALFMDQISRYKYQNEYGALGIFGGYKETK